MGDLGYGIDFVVVGTIVQEIKDVFQVGVQLVIVVGGGNIFWGVKVFVVGMDWVIVDYIGMIVMVMNVMIFQDVFE